MYNRYLTTVSDSLPPAEDYLPAPDAPTIEHTTEQATEPAVQPAATLSACAPSTSQPATIPPTTKPTFTQPAAAPPATKQSAVPSVVSAQPQQPAMPTLSSLSRLLSGRLGNIKMDNDTIIVLLLVWFLLSEDGNLDWEELILIVALLLLGV